MNKEQFKNSIVDLINYYTGNMIQYNMVAKEAQDTKNDGVLKMVEPQMMALNHGFEQGLDALLNEVFDGEEDTAEAEVVEG